MDEIDIKGEKYISSKRASEITGYTKDYVGQLARGNKILATRVGRSWYVKFSDIKKHAGIEEQKDVFKHEDTTAISVTPKRRLLNSKESEEKTYSVHRLQIQNKERNILKTWSSIKYEQDTEDLIPRIEQKKQPLVTYNAPVKKGDVINKNIVISDIRPTKLISKSQDKKYIQKKNELHLPARHISTTAKLGVIGSSVALAALVIAFVGANVASETTLSLASNQVASGISVDEALSPLYEYFYVVFNGGIIFLQGFISTLQLSFETFVVIALNFFINLF